MGFWIRTIPSVLQEDEKTGWNIYMLFKGSAHFLRNLSCHVSVLSEGKIPHPLHQHAEEELIIILCGEVENIMTQGHPPYRKKTGRLKRGSVVYLSAHHPHTIRSIGPGPAKFIVFKWSGIVHNSKNDILRSFIFDQAEKNRLPTDQFKPGFKMGRLFETPTRYLRNLCASVHDLKMDVGVKPHKHAHDLVLVLMDGRINSMHVDISAPAVIFFPAGTPHWTKNVGQIATSSFVFEFHGDKGVSLPR